MTRLTCLLRIAAGMLLSGLGLAQTPDLCGMAQAINGTGSFAFNNGVAVQDGGSDPLCLFFGNDFLDHDVWFLWTAPTAGTYTFDTCTSTIDSKLALWPAGNCPPTGALGCNDDACGLQSVMDVVGLAAGTYLLQVGTFPGAAGGAGTVNISVMVPAPTNDSCGNPININGQGSFPFSTLSASTDGVGDPTCLYFGGDQIHDDVWFLWVAGATGMYEFDTCGANFDTRIAVYGAQACPAMNPLDCNDDWCSTQSRAVLNVQGASNVYMIRIGGVGPGATGTGNLNIRFYLPHPNDECQTPMSLTGSGSFPFDTTGATTTFLPSPQCSILGNDNVESDIWLLWTATQTGQFNFEFCASSYDTKVAIYDAGACPPGTPLRCNDDFCGLQTLIPFLSVVSGQSYFIRVGGFSGDQMGPGQMDVVFQPPALNTYCSGDGSTTTPCPCGNAGAAGNGCLNSTGQGASLQFSGGMSVGVANLILTLSQVPTQQFGIIYSGTGSPEFTFGDGVRCVGGSVLRSGVFQSGPGGVFSISDVLGGGGLSGGGSELGVTRFFQGWYRDPTGPCGNAFNVSNALSGTVAP